MPYIVHTRDRRAVECSATARNAMFVPWDVWHTYTDAVARGTATDMFGRRLLPYGEMNVPSHPPYAPAGVYTDHVSVETEALEMRDRLLRERAGSRQEVLESVAVSLGLRHWRDAYNAARNAGRRITGESGRDADGNLRWRRWNRQALQAAAEAGTRVFGVEIEFNYAGSDLRGARAAILADLRQAGMTAHDRWGSYGWDGRLGGWQGTYDSTVNGGELVTPPLTGDDASMGHLRTALESVRRHGGTHESVYGYGHSGMHVSHTVVDYTNDDMVRLVDNLRNLQDNLAAYLGGARRRSGWCSPINSMGWDQIRQTIVAGGTPYDNHGIFFNFGSCRAHGGAARVEFRGWGNSLNFSKTRVWIRVGQAIMTATKAGVSFPAGVSQAAMLATLRQHGLSDWAADRWADRTVRTAVAA